MPSVFSGALVFGLVSVPIAVWAATEDHSVRFRQIHTVDGGRVRNRYWCEIEDREVSFGEIGQGYELPGGRIIPVTDEELRHLPLPTARAIELIAFVPASAVDPLRIGPGYYLQPQGVVAAKPYVLLRMALERASKVAVVRFAWHGRERLGLLRVRGPVIALHGLLWPDEVRDPAAVFPPPDQLDEEEIGEALARIEFMTLDSLEGPQFADHYTDALHAVIEAKRDARQLPEAPEPTVRPGQLVDLMAVLQESVDKARATRGETSDTDLPKAPAPPAKKATARKTARKAPAQLTSSRNAGRKVIGEVRPRPDLPWPLSWSELRGACADRPPSYGCCVGRRCRRRRSAYPPGLTRDNRRGRHSGGPPLGATLGPTVHATVQPTLHPLRSCVGS